MSKMKLGPLQRQWVANLRAHPERQTTGQLGMVNSLGYRACCLGEGLLTLNRSLGLPMDNVVFDGIICDGEEDKDALLDHSYDSLGLHGSNGFFRRGVKEDYNMKIYFSGQDYASLSALNDSGVSWPEIADFIEEHAEHIFSRSV